MKEDTLKVTKEEYQKTNASSKVMVHFRFAFEEYEASEKLTAEGKHWRRDLREEDTMKWKLEQLGE